MEEIWRDIYFEENGIIYDYRGLYQVSNLGRVKSLERLDSKERKVKGRILKAARNKYGYELVALCKNGMKTFTVHKLVASMFLPNPENKPCVDHILPISNGGANSIDNLRWVNHKENMNNPLSRINNREAQKGKHSGKNHPSSRAVVAINIENSSITIEFSSMRQAQKDGFNYGTIWKCCNGERKSHKGYYWCYKKDYIKFLESLK